MIQAKETRGRYVDINTDFGFKFYFGREENKGLLIKFLNDIFQGERIIRDLQYAPTEHDGDYEEDRRVIFDLNCIAEDGERFIIEMQQVYQEYFKDRALFYTSRLVNKQVEEGNKYLLPKIYFVGILQFPLKEIDPGECFIDVGLINKINQKVFYEKLGFKFIVLPHFTKKEHELCNDMEQWLYLIKHLSEMQKMPKYLDKRIFTRIFDIGEIAKLKKEDQMSYEASLKRKWDWESVLMTSQRISREEGIEKGIEIGTEKGRVEGKEAKSSEVVENLILEFDLSNEDISKMAKVSIAFVQEIRENLKNK